MRRIVMFDRVSADGYFSGPDGGLDWIVPEPELDAAAASRLDGTGTILFGRRTYDQFESFWPGAIDGSGTAPTPHGEGPRSRELHAMGVWINNATKIVFSRTRKQVTWKNSQLHHDFDPSAVEALKRAPGTDIMIFGSGSIVSLLTQHGLIDEYQLVVTPLLLGQGKLAIRDVPVRTQLTLIEAKAFPHGNVRLRYERAGVIALDEQLVRRESARLVAALVRIFGVHNLALAEDVTQDAFCRAIERWAERGVPDNPGAWLMTTAKHKAIDLVRRARTAQSFAPELGRLLDTEWTLAPVIEEAFAAPTIRDEQLRMMFSCCHPRLPVEAQLALVLNVLCGFAAPEIAAALLTGRAAIEKRIARGKQALAGAKRLFDLADAELPARLTTVQRALYLLFNEGYHGAEAPARAALCEEAIRLTALLRELPAAATPASHALAALMCLHVARLPGRLDAAGDLSALVDQDRARWDHARIAEGLALLEASATGTEVTRYHVEAAIAAAHAAAPSVAATDWALIAGLYDRLMAIEPSPVVALNRAIAIGQRDGAPAGLAALHAIEDRARLASYPFYPAAIGELELRRGDRVAARAQFAAALGLARNQAERRFLEKRLSATEP